MAASGGNPLCQRGAPLTGCAPAHPGHDSLRSFRLRRSASVQLAANGKRRTTLRVAPLVPTTRAPRGWLRRDQQIAATRVAKIPTSAPPVRGQQILGRQHRVSRTGLGAASGRLDPVGGGSIATATPTRMAATTTASASPCSASAEPIATASAHPTPPTRPSHSTVATRFTLPVLHVAANR